MASLINLKNYIATYFALHNEPDGKGDIWAVFWRHGINGSHIDVNDAVVGVDVIEEVIDEVVDVLQSTIINPSTTGWWCG